MLTPRRLLLVSFVIWCTCLGVGLLISAPLSPDEAAYALLARGEGDGWLYRPIGFVVFARLGAALGDSEFALRLPSTLLACALIPVVAAVGCRLGPWRGAWAAAVIAGTHTFVLRAPVLLNDIPSAICVLAAIALVIVELDRDAGPSYRLVIVAPILAAAFYLRYGSAPTIAIVVLAACGLWWRTVVARPGPIIAAGLVLGALLVPFLIHSWCSTGSLLGIIELSAAVIRRHYFGHGLVTYVVANPFLMHGALVTPVAVAGLTAIARPPPARRRRIRFLAIVAIGQIVAIGLLSPAHPRFIFVAIVLLVVLGVDVIARRLETHRHRVRLVRIAAAIVIVGWVGMLTAIVPLERRIDRGLADLVGAARAIRADAAGRPCTVVARSTPQLMWYSGCASNKPPEGITGIDPLPPDHRWYTASVPRRGIDAARVGALVGAEPVLLAPGAWYLRRRP